MIQGLLCDGRSNQLRTEIKTPRKAKRPRLTFVNSLRAEAHLVQVPGRGGGAALVRAPGPNSVAGGGAGAFHIVPQSVVQLSLPYIGSGADLHGGQPEGASQVGALQISAVQRGCREFGIPQV